MKSLRIIILPLAFFPLILSAQNQDTVSRVVKIIANIDATGNAGLVSFIPDTSQAPLTPIPNAPSPYYDFWWEFGDGHMSQEISPIHQYNANSNLRKVYLALTDKYKDGNTPKAKAASKNIAFTPYQLEQIRARFKNGSTKNNGANTNSYFSEEFEGAVALKSSSNAKPNEELAFMLSYRNQDTSVVGGQLAILFNEKKFERTMFEEREIRAHYEEEQLITVQTNEAYSQIEINEHLTGFLPQSSFSKFHLPFLTEDVSTSMQNVLDTASLTYDNQLLWSFDNLQANEERNLFFTFFATPEMLEDTSAFIHMLAVYTDNLGRTSTHTLQFEIVSAHDPNKVSVSETKEGFRRFAKNNSLTYKIQFQNEGKGPASKVKVDAYIPKGLDGYKVKLLDYHPKPPLCEENEESITSCFAILPKEDTVVFLFDGIYLPGVRQRGVNDKDSTKGFVKFKIVPQKKIKKKPLQMRAGIYFDKEPVILTNIAKTRFKSGLSIGVKGGVSDLQLGSLGELEERYEYIFGGLTFSPFKSERFYYQGEVMLGLGKIINGERIRLLGAEDIEVLDREFGLIPGIVDLADLGIFEGQFISEDLDGNQETVEQIHFQQEQSVFIVDVVPLQIRKEILPFLGIGIGGQASIKVLNFDEITFTSQRFDTPIGIAEIDYTIPAEREISIVPSVFGDVSFGLVKQGPSVGLRYHYNLIDQQTFWRAYALVKF